LGVADEEIEVWDPAVRIFHWSLVGAFSVAYFTEDDLQLLHINAGYVISVLLLFRLIWGFVGTRHARFSDFIAAPREVMTYLRQAVRFRSPRHLGHNPAGGAMVIALLVSLSVAVLSGIALYGSTDFAGPLAGAFRGELAADVLESIHELAANATVLLVVVHIGGVLFASLEHGENLIRAMITGRKTENVA
jgi:cytochrome b